MKKKILFTANLDSFFIKFLIPQLKWFGENGYEVHIAAKASGFEIPYCDRFFDVDFARNLNLKQNMKSYKQMVGILTDNEYDIISCHTPFGSAITRLAAKKCKLKNTRVVYMAHGFHFYKGGSRLKNLLFFSAEKYLAKYTDEIITINSEDYDIASKKFKTAVSYVCGVGLDEQKFNFEFTADEKIRLRNSLGIRESDFVMIYPAELLPRKRQEWLINTLEPLLKKNGNFHLLLPGNDSMNGFCQKLAEDLSLEKQIHFLGFRKDVSKLLMISDLALSSSMQEGLPVNIMEAIYVGIPVVATACRGNSDLIDVDKNGYIVAKDDAESFREKVLKVYGMSDAERKNVKDYDKQIIGKYLSENVLEEIIAIYLKNGREK